MNLEHFSRYSCIGEGIRDYFPASFFGVDASNPQEFRTQKLVFGRRTPPHPLPQHVDNDFPTPVSLAGDFSSSAGKDEIFLTGVTDVAVD